MITEVKCSFIISSIRCYQCDLTLLILTLGTWLRWCLSGYSTLKLLFLPLFHIVLFGESHYAKPTCKEWGFMLYLFKSRVSLEIIRNLFAKEIYLFPIYLSIYLFIDSNSHLFVTICTHKVLFHTLGYNVILIYYFVALTVLTLVVMNSFTGVCVPLAYYNIIGFKEF